MTRRFRGILATMADGTELTILTERLMTTDDLLKQYPCWCGHPAIEVIADDHGTRGYCHLHTELRTVVVTRSRREAPKP